MHLREKQAVHLISKGCGTLIVEASLKHSANPVCQPDPFSLESVTPAVGSRPPGFRSILAVRMLSLAVIHPLHPPTPSGGLAVW